MKADLEIESVLVTISVLKNIIIFCNILDIKNITNLYK
jgi:hypothetical protein